jgi:hypothetical protein
VKLGRLFVFFPIMTVVGLLVKEGCDIVLNPWAHSVIYSPMLTGPWLGHFSSAPPRIVFLTLHRPRSSGGSYARCRSCPDVEGWFRFCGATGASDPYRISGNVGFWRGSNLKLWFNSGRGPDFSAEEYARDLGPGGCIDADFAREAIPANSRSARATRSVVFHHASEVAFLAACAQVRQH